MGVLTYTAKRSVITGHTAGLQYSLENAFQESLPKEAKKGTREEMLDGGVEEELDYFADEYEIVTDLVDESALASWKEFFRSVGVNEQFSIDRTGTVAIPGTVENCVMVSGGYNPRRNQEGVQLYQFSFRIRML